MAWPLTWYTGHAMQTFTAQKQALLSTLLHVVELAIVLTLVYAVAWAFGLQQEGAVKDVAILAIAAVAKFIRASDAVSDYVNPKQS